jgi:sugar-specific transcriptional regulator TrmB
MSYKELITVLSECGLKRSSARVFVFLAREGPKEVRFLSKALKMHETDLASCLDNLEKRGLVKKIDEVSPEQFFAINFEKALDTLIEADLKEAMVAQKTKEAVLRYWDYMFKEN